MITSGLVDEMHAFATLLPADELVKRLGRDELVILESVDSGLDVFGPSVATLSIDRGDGAPILLEERTFLRELRVDLKWVRPFLARQLRVVPGFHGAVVPRILGAATDVSQGRLAGGLGDGAVSHGAEHAAGERVDGARVIFSTIAL